MINWQLKTPVVFIIFNRPDTTTKVFERIREAKPPKLFVIADGPRNDHPDDKEKCIAARKIIEQVDWNCEILKNYSDKNLGCEKRVSSGLDWVFGIVKEAIILEDDCLPHPSFFRYCEELLDKYNDNKIIMSITGQNVQFGRRRTEHSYYFSSYSHCWGWATWKRAWHHYDFDMKFWSETKKSNLLKNILKNRRAVKYWEKIFQATHDKKINTWDYQWLLTQWVHNGLGIIPNINLVSNIGFGKKSTHTSDEKSPYSNMLPEEMIFPLKHPPTIIPNRKADKFEQTTLYDLTLFVRIKLKIKRILKKN